MPTYNIASCTIDFPFEAYPVQLIYMEKVVLALEAGSNALLESPTGTGKTLCLLCAALGWRRAQLEKMRKQQQTAVGSAATSNNAMGAPAAPELTESWASALAQQLGQQGGAGGGPAPLDAARAPRIIYASRTHSQLQQVVRELRRTPHRPLVCMLGSREQLCCHPEISKRPGPGQAAGCQALTASNGCGFYRKLQELKRRTGRVPHPQEGIGEADRGVPDIEDFAKASEAEQLCPFYLARELQASSDVLFMPYNYLLDPKARRALNIDLRRDVLIFDEAHNVDKVCAEAASFNLTSIELAGAVRELDRCIDGARNVGVGDFGEDAPDGAAADGADSAAGAAGGKASAEELLRVKQILLHVDGTVAKLPLEKKGGGDARYVRPGSGLAELLGSCGLTADNYSYLVQKCEQCVTTLGEGVRFGASAGTAFHLQKFADVLRLAFDIERPSSEYRLCVQEMPERDRGGHSGQGGGGKERALDYAAPRTLGYWCFHSGAAMSQLVAMGVRSILLTSGTLSPLSSFADELGIPFPPQYRLENPHVIAPQRQLLVGTVPKGPSGIELTSAYTQRESDAAKKDLGNAIINFCRLIPQGVLVFFPSYSALASAHAAWARPPPDGESIVDRIKKLKTLCVEPRESSELANTIEAYTAAVQMSVRRGSGGAILLAVCRGKLSEGVDFADAACRGVIITGLPLPPAFDARVELKRSFLDQRRDEARRAASSAGLMATSGSAVTSGMLTGEEWYQQQAMRAVNQAVGRVIRHINDYGVVLLCESRFGKRKWTDGLSLWLRPHVKQFSGVGQGMPALQRFFKQHAEAQEAAAAVAAAKRDDVAGGDVDGDSARGGADEHARQTKPPSRPLNLPPPLPQPSLFEALGKQSNGMGGSGEGGSSGVGPPGLVAVQTHWGAMPPPPPVAAAPDRAARVLTHFQMSASSSSTGIGGSSGAHWLDGSANASAGAAARPRKAWAPREERPIGAGGGGVMLVGSAAATTVNRDSAAAATSAPPDPAAADKAAVAADKLAADKPAAAALLSTAKSTLDADEFANFMSIVRDLREIKAPSEGVAGARTDAVPSWLIERARALFACDGRGPLLDAFLGLPHIANAPHLASMRSALRALKKPSPSSAPPQQAAGFGRKPGGAAKPGGIAAPPIMLPKARALPTMPPKPPKPPPLGFKHTANQPANQPAANQSANPSANQSAGAQKRPHMATLNTIEGGAAARPTFGDTLGKAPKKAAPTSSQGMAMAGGSCGSGSGSRSGSGSGSGASAAINSARLPTAAAATSAPLSISAGGPAPSVSAVGAADNRDEDKKRGADFMQAVKTYLLHHGGEPAYRTFKDTMRAALFKLKGEARRPDPETDAALGALREMRRLLEPAPLAALAPGLTSFLPPPLQPTWAKLLSGEIPPSMPPSRA